MIEFYTYGKTFVLRIWKFRLEAGWFSGNPPSLFSITFFRYEKNAELFQVINAEIAKFSIDLWVGLEKG